MKDFVMGVALCVAFLFSGCSPEQSQGESVKNNRPIILDGAVECKTIDFLHKDDKHRSRFSSIEEVVEWANQPLEKHTDFDLTRMCFMLEKEGEVPQIFFLKPVAILKLRFVMAERTNYTKVDDNDAISQHYKKQINNMFKSIDKLLKQGYRCSSAPAMKSGKDACSLAIAIYDAIGRSVRIDNLNTEVWGYIVDECTDELSDIKYNLKTLDEHMEVLTRGVSENKTRKCSK